MAVNRIEALGETNIEKLWVLSNDKVLHPLHPSGSGQLP